MPVEIDPKQLPEDPSALRQIVMGLLEEAERRERKLRQLQHWVEQLRGRVTGRGASEWMSISYFSLRARS